MAMPRTLAFCSTSPPYCTEIAPLAGPAPRLGTANPPVSVLLPQYGRYRCIAPCLWCWDLNSGPQENIASPLNHQPNHPPRHLFIKAGSCYVAQGWNFEL